MKARLNCKSNDCFILMHLCLLKIMYMFVTENENTDKKSILKLLKAILGLDPHNRSLSLSPTKTTNGSSNGFNDQDKDF